MLPDLWPRYVRCVPTKISPPFSSASVQGGSCDFYILKISSYFMEGNSVGSFLKILSKEAFENEIVVLIEPGDSNISIYDFKSFKSSLRGTVTNW